jgi:hypothetical protein
MTTPTLPSYCRILTEGFQRKPGANVLRSEFENGYIRQTQRNAKALRSVNVAFMINGKQNYAAFETWWETELKSGAAKFTMKDPVNGLQITANFNGEYTAIPEGSPDNWKVTAMIEFWS